MENSISHIPPVNTPLTEINNLLTHESFDILNELLKSCSKDTYADYYQLNFKN